MHCCTMVCSQVVVIASGSTLSPSPTAISTSSTPRFFNSVNTCNQNRAPSPPSPPAQVPRMSRSPATVTPMTHRDAIIKSLKPVYTAPSEAAAKDRFAEFAAEWGQRYPALVRLWDSSWAEVVPFLEYDVEVRRVICTTNAIESINARYRRAIKARGHFPDEASALKCLHLVTRSLAPTGGGRARRAMRWKPALNAFAITFTGRLDRAIHKNRRTSHTVGRTDPPAQPLREGAVASV
jgi:mutator family transposase